MKIVISLFAFICFLNITNVHSQDSISLSTKDNSPNKLTVCFGKLTTGEVGIKDHLTDSLAFTSQKFNSMLYIHSFHMTIICNEQVIKSFENKSGNKLTDEMKTALMKTRPGCTISFGSMTFASRKKDANNNSHTLDYGSSLKLIVK